MSDKLFAIIGACLLVAGCASEEKNDLTPQQNLELAKKEFGLRNYHEAFRYSLWAALADKIGETGNQARKICVDSARALLKNNSSDDAELTLKFVDSFIADPASDRILYDAACVMLADDESDRAFVLFSRFNYDYPLSPLRPLALIKLGDIRLAEYKGYNSDKQPLVEARNFYQSAIDVKDASPEALELGKQRLAKCDELFAEREFEMAKFYIWRGHYKAGRIYLKGILTDFPNTTFAAKAAAALQEIKDKVD